MNALSLVTRGYIDRTVALTVAVQVPPPDTQAHSVRPEILANSVSAPKEIVDNFRDPRPTIKRKKKR